MKHVKQQDEKVYQAIQLELGRQRSKIELIASENFVSEAVMEAQGSVLTNKYAEGYPGRRYYGGCEHVDIVEDIARKSRKGNLWCRACQCTNAFRCSSKYGCLLYDSRTWRYSSRNEFISRGTLNTW